MYVNANSMGPDAPGTAFVQRLNGLGCPCAGGGLGCSCNQGMGLFDSGMDFTQWTWQEWFVVGLGGYVVVSLFFTGRRAARQLREGTRKRFRRARRHLGSRIAGQDLTRRRRRRSVEHGKEESIGV